MSGRGFLIRIAGVCAFGVALALLVNSQLTTDTARVVGLGVGVGVVIGSLVGSAMTLMILRGERPAPSKSAPADLPDGVFLDEEQAEALFAILKNRRQTSHEDYPLRASERRQITMVGGATLADDEGE